VVVTLAAVKLNSAVAGFDAIKHDVKVVFCDDGRRYFQGDGNIIIVT
jgi:hypothetical protein